jgi:hypothetical protein
MGGGKSSDIRLSSQEYAGSREDDDRFRRSPPFLKPGSIIPTLFGSVKPALGAIRRSRLRVSSPAAGAGAADLA